jgi:hypothetical protein
MAMTELELLLQAAMHAAVQDEQAPANLLESVKARRLYRRIRTAVAGVVMVAAGALAVPPAVSALLERISPTNKLPSVPLGPQRAAPGTVLDVCASNIGAQLPRDWREGSVAAGPLWFVDLRQATATYDARDELAVGALVVNIRDGATAWVRVVGPATGHFRFLFGQNDSGTLADGENGVTFAGCPARSGSRGNLSALPGYTQFAGYYLIDKLPRQVSLDVWIPGSSRPMRVTFLVG